MGVYCLLLLCGLWGGCLGVLCWQFARAWLWLWFIGVVVVLWLVFCRFVSLLLLWVLALFGICFGGALVLILWVLWLAGLLGLGGFVL